MKPKLLNYIACKWENYRLGKCSALDPSPFRELCARGGEEVETKLKGRRGCCLVGPRRAQQSTRYSALVLQPASFLSPPT